MTSKIFCCLKKTVLAVLDRLVSPHWPYLPGKFQQFQLGEIGDRVENAWSSVPDDPKNYDFFYNLLDADEQGRQPNVIVQRGNQVFNSKSMSCLRYIAESKDKVSTLA